MAWAPTYASTPELAAYLRITDTDDDLELGVALEAASRAIDHETSRQFGKTDSVEERTFEVDRWSRLHGRYVVKIDDIMTATGLVVTVDGSAVAASDYSLLPTNAAAEGRPWTSMHLDAVTSPTKGTGPGTVAIDATYGWTSVPVAIKQACLLQASRLFNRRHAPFGVAGSPDIGSELRLLAMVDPDVAVILKKYRRDWPRL